jgi:chorismate mutase/prephenate dehydratase
MTEKDDRGGGKSDDTARTGSSAPGEVSAAAAAPTTTLARLRQQITAVDTAVIDLLARRRDLAREVAQTKAGDGRSVRDQGREQDLLVSLIERGREVGLDAHYVTRVFHTVIDDSIKLQQAMLVEHSNPEQARALRIAFQGDKGSYSHVAIRQHFASRLDAVVYVGFDSFAEVIEAVESGTADYAMLPIENTTSGGINEVYDLLMHTPLSVIGEETVAIDHCLLGHPGSRVEALVRVYAHPQGFAQCSRYVSGLRHCRLESLETAEAVRRAAADTEHRSAAIASEQAGELYGLTVLARNIANQRENVTRFLCVGPRRRSVPLQIACKSSLVMATSDQPGSLVAALQLFRDADISIAKLESRPIIGNPWEEMFYVDVEANVDAPAMRDTLEKLTHVTRYLKVLGCYPTTNIPVTEVDPEHWIDQPGQVPAAVPHPASGDGDADTSGVGQQPPGQQAVAAGTAAPAGGRSPVVIRLRGARVGQDPFTFVVGPHRWSSRSALLASARAAAGVGARVLALGLHGTALDVSPERWREALDWLRDAARDASVATLVTVSRPEQVALASDTVDGLRIASGHMENVPLLQAAGRTTRPVLLTRGAMSSLDELLRAAAIITAEGNRQVMLCEAGISTFESATRATLDLGAVAVLRQRTALPVLIEPMPALGDAALAAPLVGAARAAGAAGCVLCADLEGSRHEEADDVVTGTESVLSREAVAAIVAQQRRGA